MDGFELVVWERHFLLVIVLGSRCAVSLPHPLEPLVQH